MKNIAELSISLFELCDFFMQYYDLYKTEELPNLEASSFSPKVTFITYHVNQFPSGGFFTQCPSLLTVSFLFSWALFNSRLPVLC